MIFWCIHFLIHVFTLFLHSLVYSLIYFFICAPTWESSVCVSTPVPYTSRYVSGTGVETVFVYLFANLFIHSIDLFLYLCTWVSTWFLLRIDHFPRKSPTSSGSFAERDLQLIERAHWFTRLADSQIYSFSRFFFHLFHWLISSFVRRLEFLHLCPRNGICLCIHLFIHLCTISIHSFVQSWIYFFICAPLSCSFICLFIHSFISLFVRRHEIEVNASKGLYICSRNDVRLFVCLFIHLFALSIHSFVESLICFLICAPAWYSGWVVERALRLSPKRYLFIYSCIYFVISVRSHWVTCLLSNNRILSLLQGSFTKESTNIKGPTIYMEALASIHCWHTNN